METAKPIGEIQSAFFHKSPLYIVSHPKRTANLRLWKGGYFYALLRLGND